MEEARVNLSMIHINETSSASTTNDGGVASITDVPDQILMEICSKLSVKSICRLRSVCKPLFNLLTSPDFVQMHFDRSRICSLLCANYGKPTLTRTKFFTFERKNRSWTSLSLFEFGRESSSVFMGFDTVFKLPMLSLSRSRIGFKPRRLSQSRWRDFLESRGLTIVNSCNGLLCLQGKMNNLSVVAIYNPVTGEYSILPVPVDAGIEKIVRKEVSVVGLGFCPNTNQYKVLLVGVKSGKCNHKVALIYTLGLEGGGWRKVESPPCFQFCSVLNPIFLNGALHWLAETYKTYRICGEIIMFRLIRVKSILSFDFEGENFRILPAPPGINCSGEKEDEINYYNSRLLRAPVKSDLILGVVQGQLYLCERLNSKFIDIWVMKNYGVEQSWAKEYVIDINDGEKWSLGSSPISNSSNDWDLLLYLPQTKSIYFIDEHQSIRYVKTGDTESDYEVFANVPSFLSIKNIAGNTLKVMNVNSRATLLK